MTWAGRGGLLMVGLCLLVVGRASAQGMGFGARGFTGGYGPGMENLAPGRGGAGYLPSGGGFLPYSPGPGGGLGVQSRIRDAAGAASSGAMGMPGGGSAYSGIGGASGRLTPLAPISGLGGGMGGMRSSRLLNRSTMGVGAMPTPPRPPVGFYPFRLPPDLGGPAAAPPGMSM